MHRFHHWRVQIKDAHDERTLARVMQDYRLTLSPAMVESLPTECQECLDNRDIPRAALTLLQAELARQDGSPEDAALLREVAYTYAAAAVKIATWRGAGKDS